MAALLLLLDTVAVAVVCNQWSRVVLQAIHDAPGRIWSASNGTLFCDLKDACTACQGRVKRHMSKATAFAKHTPLNAMRKLMALVWLLMVGPLTVFSEVGLKLLFC